jgi:putative lipoic acid-binding regulatory protein
MHKSLSDESLLVFPCDFTLKIFGLASNNMVAIFGDIIQRHIFCFDLQTIQIRHSQNNQYIALSIKVPVHSQEQLNNIYQDLSSSPQVLMVL